MDCTLQKYGELVDALLTNGYRFVTFQHYCEAMQAGGMPVGERWVVMRHDVDARPERAERMARLEAARGVQSSYYFRSITPDSRADVMLSVVKMGHELGYHYEDLCLCGGNSKRAIAHFEQQLEALRQYYPVCTICMHGNVWSKHKAVNIWDSYDYRAYGIVGEPYLDVDYNQVFYLTDTGRCWDGERYSVSDYVKSDFSLRFRHTNDIIQAAALGTLPEALLITTHPQRWSDSRYEWLAEWLGQNIKNGVKRYWVALKRED